MPEIYRLFGSELSPYSVKVRSYFRYKGIPHRWIVRSAQNMAEFQKYARLPLIPLVVTPAGEGLQDSTPILERFEAERPEPSIHPPEPATAFLSVLLEEYADEWVNKPMFHMRWTYPEDSRATAERIARENLPDAEEGEQGRLADAVVARMVPRLSFVGSSRETATTIEGSLRRLARGLETHLRTRSYLFGERPALGDFGLAAQLYQCAGDPTAGAWLRENAPTLVEWTRRMLEPVDLGEFEPWDALAPTLAPLLREEVAATFLPWSDANARALAAGESTLSVVLDGRPFRQQPQKYHAKSLRALRARYAAVTDRRLLDPILEAAGCRRWLDPGDGSRM